MAESVEISVVIPAYNAAAYIERTLASVAVQTLTPGEVVVVDDGSMDATCDIIEAFALKHPNICIRLLREPHRGPGAARNAGVRAAHYDWIAFLDSDDLWHPEKIKKMTEAIRANPRANFFCHNETMRFLDGSMRVIDYSTGFRYDRSIPRQLFQKNYFSTSAVITRRDLILRWGGFDESLSSAQDYELWLRMSPELIPVFVPEVLGTYVLRKDSITNRRYWRKLFNSLRVSHRHRAKADTGLYIYMLFRITAAHLFSIVRIICH